MNEAVGVLIVNEPDMLESTFRAFLEHEPNLHTIGQTDLAVAETGPSRRVALVFLREPFAQADAARITALKDKHPGLQALVAFQSLDAEAVAALLAAGADAFVARSAPPRETCAAILALARNQETESRPTAAEPPAVEANEGLTPREAEILRFLSAGFSNKEVARRLSLSVRTVETHRLNLRRKTQTGRLKDLVALARQLGLAPVVESEPQRRMSGDAPTHGRPGPLEASARH